MTSASRSRHTTTAFSLIEVTLSLAVVSFALLSVLALLPLGLKMMQEAQQQQAIGNIMNELRAQAQEMSPSDMTVGTVNIIYYDANGSRELAALGLIRTNYYYRVITTIASPPTIGTYTYSAANAAVMNVTLTYPLTSSGSTNLWSKIITNTIFVARQSGK